MTKLQDNKQLLKMSRFYKSKMNTETYIELDFDTYKFVNKNHKLLR